MTAVLLLAFGGPEDMDSIEPFLRNVLPGRPITPELVERVKKRYELIGGKSPLPEITRRQARLLEERLGDGFKVYVGMRHWHPFIKDTVKQIKKDGISKVVAIPMAPQTSKASTGGYIEALSKAIEEFPGLNVKTAEAWHENPLYLEAVAERIEDALDSFPEETINDVQVIFSAHSLPKRTVEGDPYESQLRETIEGVLQILCPLNWHLAYQSKGQAPGEWLGPAVEEVMERLSMEGKKDVLVVPIGFVCDHVETLYDIDVVFKNKAEELGMNFERAASLNDSPLFIEALADIVKKGICKDIMKRVIIIGGGISGLSTALYLKEQAAAQGHEIDYILIEKGNRLGGNILTEKVDGFLIEGGPDCFLSEKPWAAQLCRHLGLGDQIIPTTEENKGTFVLSKGKLHEMPDGLILMVPTKIMPLITTTLFSWSGKMRMGLDIFIPQKKGKEDETLGSFVRRRLGKEALDKIAEPLVAGVHAGDPETMSMRASFPKFMEMEEKYGSLIKGMLMRMKKAKETQRASTGPRPTMFMTLKSGLGTMIDAIISRLDSSSIKLNTSVSKIEEKDGKYLIHISGNSHNPTTPPIPLFIKEGERGGVKSVLEADSVILSTPAHVSAVLLKEVEAPLSEKLQTIPYVSTATVTLAFKSSEVKLPRSFGFVIPRVENRKIMAATFTSRKFAGRCSDEYVMIRCFVGGSKNEELVELNDKEIVDMARKELKDIIGIAAEPVLSRVYRWRKAMPQYTIGHLERVKWIFERLHQHPGLYLTGSAYNGIGISDSIREGEITAKKCLDHLFPKDK